MSREDYKFNYKNAEISCSVFEDNSIWSGSYTITIHSDDDIDIQGDLGGKYGSSDEAKEEIKKRAQNKIDEITQN